MNHQQHIPQPISREAGDRDGNKRPITIPTTNAELIRFNNAHHDFLMCHDADQLVPLISDFTKSFIEQSDALYIEEVSMTNSRDHVIYSFAPLLIEFLEKHGAIRFPMTSHFSDDEWQCLFNFILECVVEGFFYESHGGQIGRHSMRQISTGQLYQMSLVVYGKITEGTDIRRQQAIETAQQEWEERREQFKSADEDKEDDPLLSPAEKARVFRNALRSRNDIGTHVIHPDWEPESILEHRQPEKPIVFSNKDIQVAEEFFSEHRDVSVWDILTILDQCLVVRKSPSPPKFDPLFHARKGHVISFLLKHLGKIAQELDADAETDYFSSLIR